MPSGAARPRGGSQRLADGLWRGAAKSAGVFDPHDVIEGCFDEDAQGMYEVIPEPNLILRLNGEDEQSVREAFRVLAVLCETLVCASRLMKMMPGNEPLRRTFGDDA